MQCEFDGKQFGVEVSRSATSTSICKFQLKMCFCCSELRYDSLCKQIIKDMNMYGMCVVDDFLGTTNGLSILKEGTSLLYYHFVQTTLEFRLIRWLPLAHKLLSHLI